jgi:uncharacterized membrane protein YgcG
MRFSAFVRFLPTLAAVLLLASGIRPAHAQEDTGWVITDFDVTYVIHDDGSVDATEFIKVDFGILMRHGIFRDIPIEYAYDDANNRLIRLTNMHVDDEVTPHKFEVSEDRPNLRIKIGDPDRLITGVQRYRIRYTINSGLNAFSDHDEFYWNVTGSEWPVPIEESRVRITVPEPGIQRVDCFQGPTGSKQTCDSSVFDGTSARFTNGPLRESSGLTIVIGLKKGLVPVEPPELVDASESVGEAIGNFLGLTLLSMAASILLGIALIAAVARQWWIAGRDRWYGDLSHAGGVPAARRKPLFAHETIVTQFSPPEVERRQRRLRPAEIGLLVDERADTLDVTATIVDLAVRGHLSIEETEDGGIVGLFKKKDYELHRRQGDEDGLLSYEKRLLKGLFGDRDDAKLSDLKTHFHEHLAEVKRELCDDMTESLRYFPRSPEQTRRVYRVGGGVTAGIGVALMFLLGTFGAGILALPVVGAGGLLLLMAPLMPSRTADGREMYRRCLGFRTYIERAETERQAFAERANLFEEYLPYAIVYECVDKWANAFEGLGAEAMRPGWYRGTGPFIAADFASSVGNFSESISSVMASTPGGSGSSGFGGGGFSGGGGGGGGGGSW